MQYSSEKKMHISKEWYITEHTPTISIHALEFTCYIKQLHVFFLGGGDYIFDILQAFFK